MEWDQGGWLVVHLLSLTLHEDEGTVGRWLILARLGDEPALVAVVGQVAVVGGNGLELNLHLTFHGATDGEVILVLHGLEDDLLLDEVLVLVRADPGGASAQSWWVLLTIVVILDHVVI